MAKLCIKLFLICVLAYFIPKVRVLTTQKYTFSESIQDRIPLYLPKKEAVRFVTLGYENFVSQLLWFSTLEYFGDRFLAKEAMPWFTHRCDLVTDLDSRARHVFEFCGTLLSWVAGEPSNSNIILTKGIKFEPSYWRYYYLRGFNNWYFLENFEEAKKDFELASTLPDAPDFLVSLASRLMVKSGEEDTAIAFLKTAYVRASDVHAKQAIAEKLNLAVIARDIRQLRVDIEKYKEVAGRYPDTLEDLVKKEYRSFIPLDPFGDPYVYDNIRGTISSRKGGEGLSFKGKTFQSSDFGK